MNGFSNSSAAIPNPMGIVTGNLPWFGLGIWVITYAAIFILFHKSGGREKFFAMGVLGFGANVVYASAGLFGGVGALGFGTFMFSFFILIISIVSYALIKDQGE